MKPRPKRRTMKHGRCGMKPQAQGETTCLRRRSRARTWGRRGNASNPIVAVLEWMDCRLSIAETSDELSAHWSRIRASLLDGSYRPAPVRRVQIPKPDGGVRELGIPTVTDRLIQQALLQVLQPRIDPTFSEHRYGFRPGRRAHDAVLEAQRYVQDGSRVVVDVDLEKFFDRVNHDILMARLARRIDDKAVLRRIRRDLVAGIMDGGVVMERYEGTPPGGRPGAGGPDEAL